MDRTTEKPVVLLENWAVVESVAALSFEPLEPGNHLTGFVFGHARLPNAAFIYTSAILSIDETSHVVETQNTLYQLGEPNKEYLEQEFRRSAPATAA